MGINLFDYVSKEKLDKLITEAVFNPDNTLSGIIKFASIEKRSFSDKEVASAIDATILRADAQSEAIRDLCLQADESGFASVCVNPSYVALCKKMLERSKVKVCTVIGFPLGAGDATVKKLEAEQAINNGADEIDMVINIGRLKDSDFNYVYKDIVNVVETAKIQNRITKVIIETCYLNIEEKINACLLSSKAGADFVKTSTGFGTAGATAVDTALMKYITGNRMRVKAAGGIKTRDDAEMMMSCGADRIGTSSGVKIIKGI